jgi:P-type E1-E2 ATPase
LHACRPDDADAAIILQLLYVSAADSLKKMMPNKCTVIRDGLEQKVDALELVPGDLVRLYIGDRVPADIRIIETYDLKVRTTNKDQPG